jgi:riboflavin kinase/FMN adenylyltransferase
VQPVTTFSELAARLGGRSTAATIGVFDGVHVGHQALVNQTVQLARATGNTAVAITFSNHPLSVLAPPYLPRSLITNARKAQLLYSAGIDEVLMLPFTAEFAATPPEIFIERDLAGFTHVKHLVCGYDFSFGCRGAGTVALLKESGDKYGFSVACSDPVSVRDLIVKSTQIRDLLSSGKVRRAADLLSRPHEVPGRVVHGHKRGRTIGYPTANLEPPDHYQWPAIGVYACAARVGDADQLWPAMVNVGKNPTFGDAGLTIEAHLLDFIADITGEPMALYFLDRLRNEQKFAGVDELVAQLAEDRRQTVDVWQRPEILDLLAKIPAPL